MMQSLAINALQLFADTEKQIGLQKLDDSTRAGVIAALAGLVILWFGIIALTWWGARFTRRYMRSSDVRRRLPTVATDLEWAAKPLIEYDLAGDSDDEAHGRHAD